MSEIEKEERKETALKKIIKVILWIVGVIGALFFSEYPVACYEGSEH